MFFSCEKFDIKKSFEDYVSSEEMQLRLPESGFEIITMSPLLNTDNSEYYTRGVLEYEKGGIVLATINFGSGEKDEQAELDKGDEKEVVYLTKEKDGNKDFDYEKVIVEPIVKADDCPYLVSGVIKYFKGDEWTATVDFGDGTCDDIGMKTTSEGELIGFTISKYY